MKRLLGILLLLGLGALSMVVVSSAVPGGRSAHALGATGSTQTAALFVGGAAPTTTVHRYEVGRMCPEVCRKSSDVAPSLDV